MWDGRSRARLARSQPARIHCPFPPPTTQRSCLLQRASQDRFIDEERIDVTDIVFFGIQAAVPIQFSGLRGVHAQARGDARPACPSERLQAHMGSRAAPTAQPLRAQSGGRIARLTPQPQQLRKDPPCSDAPETPKGHGYHTWSCTPTETDNTINQPS